MNTAQQPRLDPARYDLWQAARFELEDLDREAQAVNRRLAQFVEEATPYQLARVFAFAVLARDALAKARDEAALAAAREALEQTA
jgi:hypothetical protein